MAVRVSAQSGYDPAYVLRGQASAGAGLERAPGGYYLTAALAGEAPGRWFGGGAEALGFAPGQQVDPDPFLAVYQQTHPVTGEQLGRRPGGYRKFAEILDQLKAAEPHATAERVRQLEREAAKNARRSPAYTDTTAAWDKTISIVHAVIRENARRAAMAGDHEGERLWSSRERRWQEILQEANRRGLDYMAEHAGWTRLGYHGRRIDGVEPGRWARALPVVTTWLQGTNRNGEPHDHAHNLWARMALTEDGKWRALDTMRVRGHLGGMAAVVGAWLESALTREFGVAWVARGDGLGNEIAGVTQEWRKLFSTRTAAVGTRAGQMAREFQARYGREPNMREMMFIRREARDWTRKRKPRETVNWDQLQAEWDGTVGGELAALAADTLYQVMPGQDPRTPGPAAQEQVIAEALDKVQREHSTWTRADLMKRIGWAMGPEFAAMDPDARVELVHQLTDRALSAGYGTESLEAPEYPPPPPSLIRDYDGRSVYTAPGTERYARRGQLALEDTLVQRAARRGAPHLDRAAAAARLGSDAATLESALRGSAQDATQATRTGLRLDQAAVIYAAFTSAQRVSLGVGPAGSGKTHTVGAATQAWRDAGGKVTGITASQSARNVLSRAGVGEAMNSSRWLARHRSEPLAPRSLVVVDEASMLSMHHLADIVAIAERDHAKVLVVGDHQQLAAVEAGGGMRLLARRLGYAQLAVPVRFAQQWEGEASLRLRAGDPAALDAYDEHGRITGGDRAEVLESARRAYVADTLAGRDTLLMAYSREDCRELSRLIRDDLVHLGRVDGRRSAAIAEGARASAGDRIVARRNDHHLETDPGHTLANGDIFAVDEVTGDGLRVRRVLEATEDGSPRLGPPVLYPKDKYATTDLGYAVTAHFGQGGTVARGEAVFTGNETREWAYVALTRGRDRNTARVVSRPRESDPRPGTAPDPELWRKPLIDAERAGQDPDEARVQIKAGRSGKTPGQVRAHEDERLRRPVGVLADILDRTEDEVSATDYQAAAAANADHLAVLHARWSDLVKAGRQARYQRIIDENLPEAYKGRVSPQSAWLYRTIHAAELSGADPEQAIRAAIRSRSLDGARDVASVLDARLRAMTQPAVPVPEQAWARPEPGLTRPSHARYVRRLAQAMDGRMARIGEHAATVQPPWAVRALGPLPDREDGRRDWQDRAAKIGAYRELYGWADGNDPIGPEPSAASPDQQASWHAAHAAIARTGQPDVRQLPDASLEHRARSYAAETGWAPPDVTAKLRGARMLAEHQRQAEIRAQAEAAAAQAEQVKDEHARRAASSGKLARTYEEMVARLEAADADRATWNQITEEPRRQAVAADAELRTRHPDRPRPPLRSAEPDPVPDDAPEPDRDKPEVPGWVAGVEAGRARFAEQAEERKQARVPDEDPDYEDQGQAWPEPERDSERILQPPEPDMPAHDEEPDPEPEEQAKPDPEPEGETS